MLSSSTTTTTTIELFIEIGRFSSHFGSKTCLNFTKDKTSHTSKLLQYLFTTLHYNVVGGCGSKHKVTSDLLEGKPMT